MRNLPSTDDITSSMWGDLPGSFERRTRHQSRIARHRREEQRFKTAQHRRRLWVFVPLALAGAVLEVVELTSAWPNYLLVALGICLITPLLTEATRG